jgi:signal transduction histidine kinase/CheY-like chemotaxis protein
MGEPISRADEALLAGLAMRRKNLAFRCGIAAVAALAFEPLIGLQPALLWASAFIVSQLAEAWAVSPLLASPQDRPALWRKALAIASMAMSNVIFGALAFMTWGYGLAGGICGVIILAGAATNSVMNTAGSRPVLIATLAPIMAYFAAVPFQAAAHGLDPAALTALTLTVLFLAGFTLSAHNLTQTLARSEREARRVSEKRRAELEEATAGKSAFLAAIGHDLRTPLSAILTGASELHARAADATERSHAGLILDAGQMMNRLLDDLLDHSRIEAGRMQIEPTVFNLRDLLARACRFWQGQARSKGVRLVIEGGKSLPDWVEADPTRVRQILNNLLSNAVKFTSEGEVRVRLNAWQAEDGRWALTIEVADTGEGMDDAQLGRLFTAFDQTRAGVSRSHGGSGLGMWISRGLATLMGGRLTVRSTRGEGTAFTLALMLDTAEAPVLVPAMPDVARVGAGFRPLPAASIVPAAPEPEFQISVTETEPLLQPNAAEAVVEDEALDEERPLRVLVVDDHDINRRAVQLILMPLGCEIAQAENGIKALELASTQPFDVIFMDVRMPELDGRETTRRLRAQDGPNQFIPVIAVTADTAPEDVKACAAAGMTWFVGKPLTPASLLGALQAVLSGESRLEHEDTKAA